MGKPSRDKGSREERALVKALRDAGLDAKRVPLSGACEGFKQDVVVWENPQEFCDVAPQQVSIELKTRAANFKALYDWMPAEGVLVVRRVNPKEKEKREFLVVERLKDWVRRL